MTLILMMLTACTPEKMTPLEIENEIGSQIVMANVSLDYSVGSLSALNLETLDLTENIASVSGDPIIRKQGDALYQLNRYQHDTLRRYEPDNLNTPTAEISLRQTGTSSSNPHDVAICAGNLYVSQYDHPDILILDPVSLLEIDRIDLGEHADSDGIPEASRMVAANDHLYVGLQRLNRNENWRSEDSKLIKIDCINGGIQTVYEGAHDILIYPSQQADKILLTSNGEDEDSGGIATLNTQDDSIEDLLETDSDDITSATLTEGRLIYLNLSADYSTHSISCLNLDTGEVAIARSGEEFLTDIVLGGNQKIYVGAHWGWQNPGEASPGIYEVDPVDCSLDSADPIMGQLAPFSMVALD